MKNHKNGTHGNGSLLTKDSNSLKNVDLPEMKPTQDITIIGERDLDSQTNNAFKRPNATDNLTQRDYVPNVLDQDELSIERMINPSDTFEKLNDRYLDSSLFDPNADIIACKSAKGTGKSYALKEVLANEPSVINLTHRRQLSKELASRWGLDYISDENLFTSTRLSMCVDSLPRFVDYGHCASLNRWKGGIVVMDECEQVLWHALYSDTCYKERIEVLRGLSILIQNARQVILCDADLTNETITFIKNAKRGFYQDIFSDKYKRQVEDVIKRLEEHGLLNTSYVSNDLPDVNRTITDYDQIKAQRITNNYVHTGRVVHSYNTKEELITEAFAQVASDKKVIIHTSGQKESSKTGTTNLEIQFKQTFPDKKVLRIDSTTVSLEGHPACGCMENINEAIAGYDVVLASPVIETGISIDLRDHFSSVFCISNGVQTVDGVAQALERVRDDVPRHVYAAVSAANNAIASGETTTYSLFRSASSRTAVIYGAINHIGNKVVDSVYRGSHNGSSRIFQENNDFTILWCEMAARHNVGYNWHRQTLLKKLKETGYEVVEVAKLAVDLGLKESLKDNVEQSKKRRVERLLNTEAIEEAEYQKLTADKNKTRTQEENDKISRYSIERDLGIYDEEHIRLYLYTNAYNQLKLRHILGTGRAIMEIKEKFDSVKPRFSLDRNKKSKIVDVLALEAIGVLDWLKLPTVTKEIADKLLADLGTKGKTIIGKALGIKWSKKTSSIKVVGSILGMLGYELKSHKQRRLNGQRVREYTIADRYAKVAENILAHMLKRDKAWLETQLEKYKGDVSRVKGASQEKREAMRASLIKAYDSFDCKKFDLIENMGRTLETRLKKFAA
ncbi:MAG: hypothetical protein QNJ72_03500 [Pleurocapsa sp. MO_226.B13]|nr:hypothetical protein [Pleurocapsa sp. MO_226.B13]